MLISECVRHKMCLHVLTRLVYTEKRYFQSKSELKLLASGSFVSSREGRMAPKMSRALGTRIKLN